MTKSLMDIHPRELKGMVKEIPTLPVIYQQLFQMMQDPNVAVPEIAEIITQDQSLSAKILHLVNSAFYGYNKEIKTISRAVVILGFRAVRSAALAISVFEYFGEDEEKSGVDMTKFWEHSIAVATISKVLAEAARFNQQEEAFIVGLLHDVGKLIEKRHFPEDFTEIINVAQEQHLSWYDTEKALFQVNHATIGKVVFRSWDFPPSVVDAVHFHHNPDSSTKFPPADGARSHRRLHFQRTGLQLSRRLSPQGVPARGGANGGPVGGTDPGLRGTDPRGAGRLHADPQTGPGLAEFPSRVCIKTHRCGTLAFSLPRSARDHARYQPDPYSLRG
jgi:putative nucleotidyltransferase with HDIG domain